MEGLENMHFDPDAQLDEPDDLYCHYRKAKHDDDQDDGGHEVPSDNEKSYVKAEYEHIFKHSASSAFLAYLPIFFRKQCVWATNLKKEDYNEDGDRFSLHEMMEFFGILLYMRLVNMGEINNYWDPFHPWEDIVREKSGEKHYEIPGMAIIMPRKRFWSLRKCLSINREEVSSTTTRTAHEESDEEVDPRVEMKTDSSDDPLYRIRPLINVLKSTCAMYVVPGRNVALDEHSCASKSSFARFMICFNPSKPGGKYHFKVYCVACGDSWIVINFVIHATVLTSKRLETLMSSDSIKGFVLDTE